MKKLITTCAVVALSCLTLAYRAGAIELTTDSQEYVGLISPNHPANEAKEASYINFLITLSIGNTGSFDGQSFTRSDNSFTTLPTATSVDSFKDESESNAGDFGGGYTYLLAKYNGGSAGALVWYVGDLTGEFTLPATYLRKGLSHYTLFNPGNGVPDGGTTLVLLGAAITALGLARRKMG